MILIKETLLEEIEQDINYKSEEILKLKENYNTRRDLDKVLELYNEIKKLEYMKEYINSLQYTTEIEEEKNLTLNEMNYV